MDSAYLANASFPNTSSTPALISLSDAYRAFCAAREQCLPWAASFARLMGKSEAKIQAMAQRPCVRRLFAPDDARRLYIRDAFDEKAARRLLASLLQMSPRDEAAEGRLQRLLRDYAELKTLAFVSSETSADAAPGFIDAYYRVLVRFGRYINKEDAVQGLFEDPVRLGCLIYRYQTLQLEGSPLRFREYLKGVIGKVRYGRQTLPAAAGPRSKGNAEGTTTILGRVEDHATPRPEESVLRNEALELVQDALSTLKRCHPNRCELIRARYFPGDQDWAQIDSLLSKSVEALTAEQARRKWEVPFRKARQTFVSCLMDAYYTNYDTDDPARARKGLSECLAVLTGGMAARPEVYDRARGSMQKRKVRSRTQIVD